MNEKSPAPIQGTISKYGVHYGELSLYGITLCGVGDWMERVPEKCFDRYINYHAVNTMLSATMQSIRWCQLPCIQNNAVNTLQSTRCSQHDAFNTMQLTQCSQHNKVNMMQLTGCSQHNSVNTMISTTI